MHIRIVICSLLVNILTNTHPISTVVTSCDSIFEKEEIITECIKQLDKKISKKKSEELLKIEHQHSFHLIELKNTASRADISAYQNAKQKLKAHQVKYLKRLRKLIEKFKKKSD